MSLLLKCKSGIQVATDFLKLVILSNSISFSKKSFSISFCVNDSHIHLLLNFMCANVTWNHDYFAIVGIRAYFVSYEFFIPLFGRESVLWKRKYYRPVKYISKWRRKYIFQSVKLWELTLRAVVKVCYTFLLPVLIWNNKIISHTLGENRVREKLPVYNQRMKRLIGKGKINSFLRKLIKSIL